MNYMKYIINLKKHTCIIHQTRKCQYESFRIFNSNQKYKQFLIKLIYGFKFYSKSSEKLNIPDMFQDHSKLP